MNISLYRSVNTLTISVLTIDTDEKLFNSKINPKYSGIRIRQASARTLYVPISPLTVHNASGNN